MHEYNLIKSVSFIAGSRRVKCECDSYGKFPVYQRDAKYGKNTYLGNKTVKELISWVLVGDPVLNLRSGDSVRVCQGGSTKVRVEALCLLEAHDDYFYNKARFNKY